MPNTFCSNQSVLFRYDIYGKYVVSKVIHTTTKRDKTLNSFICNHTFIYSAQVCRCCCGWAGKGGLEMDGFTVQTSLCQAFEGLNRGADGAPVNGFTIFPLLQ